MKTEKITFTSRINFVDAKTFEKFRKGQYVNFRVRNHLTYKANEIYTDEVRTCTAGYVTDLETKKVEGFHYYDDLLNYIGIDDLKDKLSKTIEKTSRALLIGGKDLKSAKFSLLNLDMLVEFFKNKTPNLTLFKQHNFPWSESNFHYDIKTDTCTIHSMFRPHTEIKQKDVLTKDDLLFAFKEIKIADGDELYMNGQKVII